MRTTLLSNRVATLQRRRLNMRCGRSAQCDTCRRKETILHVVPLGQSLGNKFNPNILELIAKDRDITFFSPPVVSLFSFSIIFVSTMERTDDLSLQFNSMNLEGAPPAENNGEPQQQSEFPQGGDGAQSSNCNLIVNYLPHDVDDNALRVRGRVSSGRYVVVASYLLSCVLLFVSSEHFPRVRRNHHDEGGS